MSALLSFLITVTRVWGCVLAGANPAQVDETPRAVESGAADLERIDVYPASVELKSARSQVQLVVTGYFPDGEVRDITDVVRLKIEAPQFAEVVGSSLIPRADGQTQLKVVYGARQAQVQVTVSGQGGADPVKFQTEVLAVLTKQGCNAGSCHGAPEGKGGFALSMLAYAPHNDAQSLIRDGHARRTTPIQPEESLLLRKPMLRVPHVGGKRLRKTDAAWQVLTDWISAGAKQDAADSPTCVQLTVYPPRARVLRLPHGRQQLSVQAVFSDGSIRDVTPIATFTSTNLEVVTVDAKGLVTGHKRGMAAITVRYLSLVESVFFTFEQALDGFEWNDPAVYNAIDRLVHTRLKQMQFRPSQICDDSTFLRRLSLDLTGLLPTAAETIAFLADSTSDKRARRVEQMLQSEEFAHFWASKTADLMRANPTAMPDGRAQLFVEWLTDSLRRNQPFDQFTQELLTAAGDANSVAAASYFLAIPDREALAETTAQLFMGSRINCAKCHNHPFESWTQNDYYRIAAVFARIKSAGSILQLVDSGEVTHPASGAIMRPWGAAQPTAPPHEPGDRRAVLAAWLTQPDNVYFSRVEANRIWSHLLGRGIVHPVDDFRSSNPPANPELLDWLTTEFRGSGYDRKSLVRLICNSATYQRSAATDSFNAADTTLFSHYYARRMTAEQLFDAVGYSTRTIPPISIQITEIRQQAEVLANRTAELDLEYETWEAAQREKLASVECNLSPWHYAGVFAEPNYEIAVSTAYAPEQALDLLAPLPGDRRWTAHPDWVDGQQHAFPTAAPGSHYVARMIMAARPGKAVMSFGSDDGLRVWLNGKLQLDKPERRGISNDADQIEVDLVQGANLLLLKVLDAGGYTGFFCRQVSFDGHPVSPTELSAEMTAILRIVPAQLTSSARLILRNEQRKSDSRWTSLRQQQLQLSQLTAYHTQRAVPEQNDFLQAFGQPKRESPCTCERLGEPTIDQTLQILNGDLVWSRTRDGLNSYLSFTDNESLLNEIFLSALARLPQADEREKLTQYLHDHANRAEAIQDLLWIIINFQEFVFQH